MTETVTTTTPATTPDGERDRVFRVVRTLGKRERLVARDPTTINKALRLLDGTLASRAWYVLEGRSQPDACLETDTQSGTDCGTARREAPLLRRQLERNFASGKWCAWQEWNLRPSD